MSKKLKVDKTITKAKEIGFENEVFPTIYTVVGEDGDYSDRDNWNVCSYENEELANEHVEKANEYVQQVIDKHLDDKWSDDKLSMYNLQNPYDREGVGVDFNDVKYYTRNTKLIKRVTKWPFLEAIFIARYKEVQSPFHKDKLPLDIFKLICEYVVNKYRF